MELRPAAMPNAATRQALGLTLLLAGLAAFSLLAWLVPTVPANPKPGRASEIRSQLFAQRVLPVLERRCAQGCHGIEAAEFSRFARSPLHAGAFYFPFDSTTGRIPRDDAIVAASYAAALGEGDHARVLPGEAPEFSAILRKPMAEVYGGLPHAGLGVFNSPNDPDYEALRLWVAAEIEARPVEDAPWPAETRFFRDNVLGVLERNACFLASCHGTMAFNDLKLTAPLHSDGETSSRYSRRMIEANRLALLGQVTRFANLGGDLTQSRLIRKNLPIAKGGIHQRGGNDQFFDSLDDADVQLLLQWLARERKALAARLRAGAEAVSETDLGKLQAVAFIRGPRHAPRSFFDVDTWWPGSDIWLARMAPDGAGLGGEPINLTAKLHATPVEIQALDVRYDGRAIVFSMRQSADSGFRLYEIGLENGRLLEGSFRQLSFGDAKLADGTLVHHLDPVYTPGPGDPEGARLDVAAIAFASNAAGAWVASNAFAILGEADGGRGDMLVDEQRTEAPHTFDDRRISILAGPFAGQTRRIVAQLAQGAGSRLILDAPLAGELDRQTVYEIEETRADFRPAFDIWRLVPGAPQSARRMTFSNAQERRPTMRSNGELMFTSVRNTGYQDGRPVFNGAIFRVHNGGWDYHIHGGNRSRYPLYTDSREFPNGLEVRLALDPRNLWGGGLLLLADHGFGVNVEPDNPVDHFAYAGGPGAFSGVRFIPSQVPLFSETGPAAICATGRSPGGAFRDPFPLPDGRLLVSRSEGFDHLDARADPDWNLALLSFPESMQSVDGASAGRVVITRLDMPRSSDFAEYCPRPVMVRLKEKHNPHQKFSAREGLPEAHKDYGVERLPEDTPADVECYDYPLLEAFLTNFAPMETRTIRDRELRYVRILAQEPLTRSDARGPTPDPFGLAQFNDPFATKDSLGVHTRVRIVAEVALEPDGSFYAAVPPNTPLLIQGLNAERMALHSMQRWFYTQPGERLTFSIPRSIFPTRCGGCHGALTGNPDDQFGPPDIASASSQVMANWDPQAKTRRQPAGLKPTQAASVDFARDVQPLLDRKCVPCHGSNSSLDLRATPMLGYSRSYVSLLQLEEPSGSNFAARRWVAEREGLAVKSHLIELITGRELLAPQKLPRLGVKHPEASPLSEEEVLILVRWIDTGATFRGGGK
jgi:Hydrazine synthase alpha subunit middle domain